MKAMQRNFTLVTAVATAAMLLMPVSGFAAKGSGGGGGHSVEAVATEAEVVATEAEVVATEAEVVGTVAEAALTWALDRQYPVRLQGRLPAATPCARHPAARP
jgi:hypothetical protein